MEEEMRQAEQLSRALRDQRTHWLIRIEEARPRHIRNSVGQGGLRFAPVKRVVTLPKGFPSRQIASSHLSDQDLVAQGCLAYGKRPNIWRCSCVPLITA